MEKGAGGVQARFKARKVRTETGEEVKGNTFTLSGVPWAGEFVSYKQPDGKITVHEVRTGTKIAEGASLGAAKTAAERLLVTVGQQAFEQRIQDRLAARKEEAPAKPAKPAAVPHPGEKELAIGLAWCGTTT